MLWFLVFICVSSIIGLVYSAVELGNDFNNGMTWMQLLWFSTITVLSVWAILYYMLYEYPIIILGR